MKEHQLKRKNDEETSSGLLHKVFRLNDVEDHNGIIHVCSSKEEGLFGINITIPSLYESVMVFIFSSVQVEEIVEFYELSYRRFWKFNFPDAGASFQRFSYIINLERIGDDEDIVFHLSINTKLGQHLTTSITDEFEESFYRLAKEYPKDTIS